MPLIIGQEGSALCCCGPCKGYPALDGSHRFFKYATIYDYDSCYFNTCTITVPTYGVVDGSIKILGTGCGYGVVEQSTGNYQSTVKNGVCIDCKSFYQAGKILARGVFRSTYLTCGNYFASTPGTMHPTKLTLIKDAPCSNANGDKIWVELTEEILDGSCDSMGACCGWRDYGQVNGTGILDDKKTCRMAHRCECDTAKGETWHGEGSTCESRPCFCGGFKAFDGSNKYYEFAEYKNTGNGSYTVKWTGSSTIANTQSALSRGVVIASTGIYVAPSRFPVSSCASPPSTHRTPSNLNTATYSSDIRQEDGQNVGPGEVGWRLSGELSCTLNPLP